MTKKTKIQLIIFAVLGVFVVSVVVSSIQPQRPGNSHDGRRGSDIRQMALGVELYNNENHTYPIVESGCQSMDLLEDFLVPFFAYKIPQERFTSEGHPPYQYAVSQNGEQFVVKATFYDNPLKFDQRRLDNDLDGTILGCNCNDPNYCVGSESLEI